MLEQLVALNSALDRSQKVSGGILGLVTGVALIVLLGFAGITSTPLQVLLGIMAVIMMVIGTLLLGTSNSDDQIV